MLYLALELSLFVVGAFLLGWWFGRKSNRSADSDTTSQVAAVEVELLDEETNPTDVKRSADRASVTTHHR